MGSLGGAGANDATFLHELRGRVSLEVSSKRVLLLAALVLAHTGSLRPSELELKLHLLMLQLNDFETLAILTMHPILHKMLETGR